MSCLLNIARYSIEVLVPSQTTGVALTTRTVVEVLCQRNTADIQRNTTTASLFECATTTHCHPVRNDFWAPFQSCLTAVFVFSWERFLEATNTPAFHGSLVSLRYIAVFWWNIHNCQKKATTWSRPWRISQQQKLLWVGSIAVIGKANLSVLSLLLVTALT